MKRIAKYVLLLFFIVFLVLPSCGVKHRIEKNQALFDSLSAEQQQLIRKRKIQKNFSPEMVTLSWGHPTAKLSVKDKKTEIQAWIYARYNYGYEPRRGIYDYHRLRESVTLLRYVIFTKNKVSEFRARHYTFHQRLRHWSSFYCEVLSMNSDSGCALVGEMIVPRTQTLRKFGWY